MRENTRGSKPTGYRRQRVYLGMQGANKRGADLLLNSKES